MSKITTLEHHCNSWVITRKSDGQVIGEFYRIENVKRFNHGKVIIQSAAQYLSNLNK